jgi:hypothetical protein
VTNSTIQPANVHALVVGIEKYQAGSDWNLHGPANDALDFANWLLAHKVEPEQIYLFLSPLDRNQAVISEAKAKGLTPHPATRHEIEHTIKSRLISETSRGDLLYVFWGGHGTITQTDRSRRLLFDDNDTELNLNVNSLVDALSRSAYGTGFPKQIFLIDACANPIYQGTARIQQVIASEVKFAASGYDEPAEQFVLFASPEYEVATNDSNVGTGRFSQAVLKNLQGKPLLPDMKAIAERIKSDFLEKQQIPPAYWLKLGDDQEIANRSPGKQANWLKACRTWLEEQERIRSSSNPRLYRKLTPVSYVPVRLRVEKYCLKNIEDSNGGINQASPQVLNQSEWLKQLLSVDRSRNIAIIGEPGCGKSTLLQQVALWLLNEHNQVALWISLADLRGETLEIYLLEEWLRVVLPIAAPKTTEVIDTIKHEFRKLLRSDHFWLLLDGLDEMPLDTADPQTAVRKQLRDLIGLNPASHVILTCRSNFWDAERAASWFDTYRILELSDTTDLNQVQNFITHWFWQQPQQGQELKATLSQPKYRPLKDLVKNPLRLALVCHLWQSSGKTLPDTLTELYAQFLHEQWNRDVAETQLHHRRDELKQALGKLAIEAIDTQELPLRKHLVEDQLGRFEGLSVILRLGWLHRLENPNDPEKDDFKFSHTVFRDYFAAQAIGDDWRYFFESRSNSPEATRIFDTQWQNVILLWLEQPKDSSETGSKARQEFIEALVKFKDNHDNIFQTCTLFSAACLVAANLTSHRLSFTLHRQLVDLYRSTSYQWLQEKTFLALQQLSHSELFQFLQEELNISHRDRHSRAIQAMGNLANDRAIKQLVHQCQQEGDEPRLIVDILFAMQMEQAKEAAYEILEDLIHDREQLPRVLAQLVQFHSSEAIHWFTTIFQHPQTSNWIQSIAATFLGKVDQPEVKAFLQQQIQQMLDDPNFDQTALLNTIHAIQIPLDQSVIDQLKELALSIPTTTATRLEMDLRWAVTHFLVRQHCLTWQEMLSWFPVDSYPSKRDNVLVLLAQYQDHEAEIQAIQISRDTYSARTLPKALIVALSQFGSLPSFQYLAEQFQYLANDPSGDLEKEQAIVQALHQISQRSPDLSKDMAPFMCSNLLGILQRYPTLNADFANVAVPLIFQFAQEREIQTLLQLMMQRLDLRFELGDACVQFLEQESAAADRYLMVVQQAIQVVTGSNTATFDAAISDSGLAQAYLFI